MSFPVQITFRHIHRPHSAANAWVALRNAFNATKQDYQKVEHGMVKSRATSFPTTEASAY